MSSIMESASGQRLQRRIADDEDRESLRVQMLAGPEHGIGKICWLIEQEDGDLLAQWLVTGVCLYPGLEFAVVSALPPRPEDEFGDCEQLRIQDVEFSPYFPARGEFHHLPSRAQADARRPV
jgi:hypothetical protein